MLSSSTMATHNLKNYALMEIGGKGSGNKMPEASDAFANECVPSNYKADLWEGN